MGFFDLIKNKDKKLIVKYNVDALLQVFDAYSYFGNEKHIFNEKIIEKYSCSNNSNDFLAVAISYLGEGASERKNSIKYFEKYLLAPTSQKYFSEWFIYSSLATLYEKEYLFDKAIICLDKLIELDCDTNIADYTRKGDILIKQNIDDALLYYQKLKHLPLYQKYKDTIDMSYNNVLTKKQNGYVYRPRKIKK